MTTEAELTPALRGAPYIQAGLHIFPVCWRPGHSDHKRPLPNYPWRRRCTTTMSEWVQDCDEAERLWGIDHVAVAWACGEDDYVLIDLDRHEDIPGFFDAFEWATLRYETHRGWHYVAKFPVEFEPGNGVTALRTSVGREAAAGIDIRGKGGYAIVDTPDGLRHMPIEGLELTRPFPRPDWLEPFNDRQVDHVTKNEIKAFADRCRHHRQPGSLDGIATMLANFDERWPRTKESRHNMLLGMVTQVAIEAKRGYYPFEDGVRTVQAWWKRVIQDPTRDPQPHEWGDALSWAVGRAKQEPDPPTDDDAGDEPESLLDDDGITLINWHEFFTKERLDPEWLVQDLWPFGRHISIGSKAGQGKSELIQYVVSCLALGIDPWTRAERRPVRVIYLDMEMTEEDLYSRMTDFGYGVEQAELLADNLLYAVLPVIPALNSQVGLRFVERLVDRYRPDVFILDTFMKTLTGDENDAATVQEFTRLSGMLLKSRRVASGRADHYGKKVEQGNRGTSAKDDDVDVAWRLERSGRYTTRLTATKRRQGFVPERLFYERFHTAEDGVRFTPRDQIVDSIPTQAAHELITVMDLLEIPTDWGRDRIKRALVDNGYTPGRNDDLAEAIRLRKSALNTTGTDVTDDDPSE